MTLGGIDDRRTLDKVQYMATQFSNSYNFPAQKIRVNAQPVDLNAYLSGQAAAMSRANQNARRRSNINLPILRPEIGSDVNQLAPDIAEKIFELVPGAQRTDYLVERDNNVPSAIQASIGIPSAVGCNY